ncbi:MAG: peptide ABC transporter substrate-binding protein [Oscillospiraceae bacterium]|nr:peptide ABC transporter substrate-binding protein [Oscillospiraceae bacterium]
MNHLTKKILCLCLPAILLSGCSTPFHKEESDGSGYLFTYTLLGNPENLDPLLATDASSKLILRNMMQGLLKENPDGTISNAIAEQYTMQDDGLSYTFSLRDDCYWYFDENQNEKIDDGETWQVTAYDFVYAFQRMFLAETRSPYREMFSCLAYANEIMNGTADYMQIGVTAQNETTLTFQLAEPNSRFPELLAKTAALPCNEAFFLKTKGRYGLDATSVISNGAFYMRKWFYDPYGSDNLIYMQCNSANDQKEGDRKVYPSDLTFLIRKKQSQAEEAFTSEVSDIFTTTIYPQNEINKPEEYLVTSYSSITLGLVFNPNNNLYANQNIRKALSESIDRENIGKESNGDLTGASGIIPPDTRVDAVKYRNNVPETALLYDNDTAKQDFQKGLEELQIDSLPSDKILVCPELMDCSYLHEILQNWQHTFEFYIGIEEVTAAEYEERLQSGNYTIALYGVTGSENNPASVLSSFASDANPFYQNDAFDALLSQTMQCNNAAQLTDFCMQMENLLLADYCFLPVYYKCRYLIYRSENRDIFYDPYSGIIDFQAVKHFGS